MKRDMDLIRQLLLMIESSSDNRYSPTIVGDFTPAEVGYHCHLLVEGGLATGSPSGLLSGGPAMGTITGLTWQGHDFIDKAKDEGRWAQAKATIKAKALPATIEVFSKVLGDIIKAAMGMG